ncbi:MAG: AAA family ATPase [Bdellovibrio sp.]|nr:MAG: AAA family ATPase [Bdellovibrio sp.]
MKLLITGKPGSGKTTLLKQMLSSYKRPKRGFLTEEIRENSSRVGFKIITDKGKEALLASKKLPSERKHGSYYVHIAEFEELITSLFDFTENDLLYIDEIGPMELFSEKFKELVKLYMEAENDFIGTIKLDSDDQFIKRIKGNAAITIVEIKR